MMRLLFFIVVLIFAVWLGVLIKNDPGYMLLAFHHWSIEMPLWLGILFIVIAFLIVFWSVRFVACLFGIPDRVRFWSTRRRIRKAHKKTNRGLISLAEGNWAAAEKHLIQASHHTDTPLINYLAAARAAQARGAYDRRDNYLREAIAIDPDAEVAVGLTQAQLQLEYQQYEQALATLRHLRDLVPHHKYVLKLLANLYQRLNDWASLQELLPDLRRYHVFTAEELQQLSATVLVKRLANCHDDKTANKIWQTMPRFLQHEPELIAHYVPHLIATKPNEAEELIRETLKKHWDEKLLLLYADILNIDHKKQLGHAEHWLKHHKNDSLLLYVLGKISLQNQLWGKARSYFEASISVKPNVASYESLGNLLEKLGDMPHALVCYKNALALKNITG